MGACCIGSFTLPDPPFDRAQGFREGADRAQGKTLATGNAVAVFRRCDPGLKAAALDVDGRSSRHLPAGLDASPAEDAAELPVTDQRRGVLFFSIFPKGLVFNLLDPVFIGELLEQTFTSLVALGTIQRMRGEDEVEEFPPHLQEPVRSGDYGNTLHRRCGAGGHRLLIAFHLHDAEAAGSDRGEPLMVTEGRDGDASLPGRLEDGLPLLGDDLFSVDG